MTVYVNDVQRAWQQMSFTSYPDYNDNLSFYINRPSGTLQTSYTRSELVVDTFGIWDAKRELLKACGTLPNIPPEVKHDAIYPDSQKGYIRLFYIPTEYEVKYNMDEELTIRFQATDEDGLLWYNVDGDIRSYLYLQDGDLWFATQKGNQPANKRWITNGQNFHNSKKDHVLVMKSSNGNSHLLHNMPDRVLIGYLCLFSLNVLTF
ncbi:hypothetical protein EB796_003952 [Bugula neritina]|uniref:Uncharacterized protein n=1 Tax=Bugula neritina TaxID=10212 RepID=A0A7J7KHJ5_BUGNE|nr:hypothetical protein EB796_003952 [Bugula neritina]